jgi:inhibitor of cysteine peptidase
MNKRGWYSGGIVATVLMLIVALAAMASPGCGSSANASGDSLKLSEADNGKTYTVKIGDTIEAIIPGNPTTGYAWTSALSEKDATLIQSLGEPAYASEASESTIVGAGGVYTFTFKAAAAGEAVLKLVYSRSWESVEPLQTFAVTLTIK